jgi:biotin carboxyl carrier protein
MYTIKVNNGSEQKVELSADQQNITVDGKVHQLDLSRNSEKNYHLLLNNRSYSIELVKENKEEKTLLLKVNGSVYSVAIKDKYDELLKNLGLDNLLAKKVNEVKAPMPGMVLNIMVNAGDSIKKGDPILILEAMKMENILKSPADGVVKKINAIKGNAVEKNQVLIQFA